MTTPAIRRSGWLLCLALSAWLLPAAPASAEEQLTPVERSASVQRHVVAKPAYPVWKDAARLVDDRPDDLPTAQRRTAYQNPPDPRNLRGLSDGFREGTRPLTEAGQQAGQWIDEQARGLADGTQRFVDQAGENLRSGTQNVLNGTANTLERALPGSTSPYADRTQYNANDYGRGVAQPPAPTGSEFASPGTGYNDAQLRDAQLLAEQRRLDEQQRARRQYEAETLAAEQRAYQQRLERERAAARSGVTSSGLAEPFADEADRLAGSRTQLSPVRRAERDSFASERDAWRPFDDSSAGVEDYAQRESRDYRRTADSFPALRPPQNAWNENLARGQSPNSAPGFNQQPPPYSPPVTAASTTGSTTLAANGTNNTGWNGEAGSQQATGTNTTGDFVTASTVGDVTPRDGNSIDLDRFLLVVLGAASCFTWLAYYDVRQKYRLALRGVQVSDFGSQSAAA